MSNMVVNTNVLALNSHRNLSTVGVKQQKASQRLSSGLRVNSAADDAAGLAISEKMRGQIRGLDQAVRNGNDGISMIQTAEGGLQEITNMVQRIRELTVQAVNDSNTGEDRVKILNEVNQLIKEIDDEAGRVEFNTKKLISGAFNSTDALAIQIGANASQLIKFEIASMSWKGLSSITSVGWGPSPASMAGMTAASLASLASDLNSVGQSGSISNKLSVIDRALRRATDERAKLGAIQNRVEYSVNSLKVTSENLSSSESRIRDTDMAKEMMNLTKANVLNQAAISMLAQANQAPQSVLQLLQ